MAIHNDPINGPATTADTSQINSSPKDSANSDDVLIGLAFSGGGMRAAAFSYGVLSEFDRTRVTLKGSTKSLLDRVEFVSGVSGGAVTAAYFGLKGRSALADFRQQFLMRNAEESLSTSMISPVNIYRAYEGGINDTDQLPRWLDDNLFHGATFRSLGPRHRPQVWINAADIYNRTPFVFNRATFDAICSDLSDRNGRCGIRCNPNSFCPGRAENLPGSMREYAPRMGGARIK